MHLLGLLKNKGLFLISVFYLLAHCNLSFLSDNDDDNFISLATTLLYVNRPRCQQSAETHFNEYRRGPYLIYDNHNNAMRVLFKVSSQDFFLDNTAKVKFGYSTDYEFEGDAAEQFQNDFQYNMTNLAPGSNIFYRVEFHGQVMSGSFRTAQASDTTNLSFYVMGDSRSGPKDLTSVFEAMLRDMTIDARRTFLLHLGDMANHGDYADDWQVEWFDPCPDFKREIPVMTVRRNHENTGVLYREYFPQAFVSPPGAYYSFDYGPVHVAVVDQYVDYTTGSDQLTWLDADLAASTKLWKIVAFHEPGWSGGTRINTVDVQTYIQPILKTHNVKIVFAGHNHYYSRNVVDGVTHITTGGPAPLSEHPS